MHARKLRVEADFLQFPARINRSGREREGMERLSLEDQSGKVLRSTSLEFPPMGQEPDFWYSYDVREFRGKEVALVYKSEDPEALSRIRAGNIEIRDPRAYEGPHRPRFHFSPRLGWMNDINGSYYHDGLYHIFYQANPMYAGPNGAGFNMHWGHSVSKDLVHWEEWPIALFPDATGQCYSGSAVLQVAPCAGVNEGVPLPAPVLFFSATAPFSQHLATTPDGGRTWARFAGNPVVPNLGQGDRDPKVFWYEASKHYVMVLFVGGDGSEASPAKSYRFLRSPDLVHWEQTSILPDWYECPEFFPVKSPTTGKEVWVLYGCYMPGGKEGAGSIPSACQIGNFDGKAFTPLTPPRPAHQRPNFYAALLFAGAPNGRNIMMGWANGVQGPGEPFSQCASIPLELTLKAFAGEDKMCFEPVKEMEALRGEPLLEMKNVALADANAKLASLSKEAPLDLVLRLRPADGGTVTIANRKNVFSYDAASGKLMRGSQHVVLHPGKTMEVRFLIDRAIVEAFWNGGEAAYSMASLHTDDGPAFSIKGEGTIESITVYPMADIWKPSGATAENTPVTLAVPLQQARGISSTLNLLPYRSPGNNNWDHWYAQDGGVTHVFYLEYPDAKEMPDQSKRHGGQWVGHATSTDLVHWQEQPTALWEKGKGIATGSVVRYGGKWHMLVTHQGLSLAESHDLVTWKWSTGNPVHRGELLSGDWQGKQVSFKLLADPYIYPEPRGAYWYAVVNAHIHGAENGERGAQVLIRSKDLRTWEGYKVCAWDKAFDRMETAQIWERGGRWYLYFGGVIDFKPGVSKGHVNTIYMAKAFDGPYEAQPWSRITLPFKGYIGKCLRRSDGSDVFLLGQDYSVLSRPIPMRYGEGGRIDFD